MFAQKNTWLRVILPVMLMLTLLLSACGQKAPAPQPSAPSPAPQAQQPAEAPKPSEYLIGATMPLSGVAAVFGELAVSGGELAIKMINEKGGINGVPLKMVHEDGQLDVPTSVAGLQKLIDVHKVPVFITSGSAVALAQAPIATERKTLLVNVAAQSPKLRDEGPWLTSFIPTSDYDTKVMADMTYNMLGIKAVAMITVDSDFGIDTGKAFRAAYEALGGKMLGVETHPTGANDMRAQLIKLKALNPAAVANFSNTQEAGHVIRQAREVGISVPMIGGNYTISPDAFAVAGPAMNGTYGAMLAFNPDKTELSKQFSDRYKQEFGKDPTIYAAITFDATRAIAEAIRQVGYDATAMRDYINNLKDFPSVFGSITMDKDGFASFPLRLYKVENEKVVDYK